MARMNKEDMMAMAGKELVALADSMGVKVAANKERTALKEAKAKVVERLLAAMPEEEEVEERPVMKVDGFTADEVAAMPEAEEQEVAEAEKKKKAGRVKKDLDKLVGNVPVFENTQLILNRKRGVIYVKYNCKKIMAYNGKTVVAMSEKLVNGLEYNEKSYGFVVAPTMENMKAIFANAR